MHLEYSLERNLIGLMGSKENSHAQQMLVTWTQLSCGITLSLTTKVMSV